MYKVHQGPSKFNVHNRRVLTQQLDPGTESKDTRPEFNGNGMSSLKPVFHSQTLSDKWQGHHSRSPNMDAGVPGDQLTPVHIEKVRMLNEAWLRTKREIEEAKQQRRPDGETSTVEYLDKREHPVFQNFEPMDLEKEQLAYMMCNQDTT
ncbi:uncharacterized protein LOC117292704 [Asterias rubens]|uniref:uncharacterized protein LOC117292704 n=1 Tax=Asterias rubens TaxID=7604 RepID=UPI0014558E19|nr:uncharacterized protein LOC117292704 [Asterias rubens]